MTKQEQKASAARAAEEAAAREAGDAYFKDHQELMLAEVHRYANKKYEQHYLPHAFAEGYQAARKRHDAYLAEKAAEKVSNHIDGFDRDDLGESPDY